MKYLDIHTHVFPEKVASKVVDYLENYYQTKWQGTGTVPDLQQSMDDSGIDRAVIFSTATKPEQVPVIHDFIAEACRRDKRFIGFGTMHCDYPDPAAEIDRLIALGLRGIKFHPDFQGIAIDDERMMPIYRLIGNRLPLLFHVGDRHSDLSSPRRMANLMRRMPELTIIAAHLGGYSQWDQAWRYLVGKNCYLDCSSCFHFLSYRDGAELIREHGINRVLFASDYPAVKHRKAIEDVLNLGFSEAENERIFWNNAAELLKIKD